MKMTTLSTQYSSPELTQHLFCIEDGFASSPTGIDGVSMQRIVIPEYQTFNLLAVQMGYGKPMGIECKALRTIYFVS